MVEPRELARRFSLGLSLADPQVRCGPQGGRSAPARRPGWAVRV